MGPRVFATGTRTLSKVTYAVPAAAEYAVLMGLVETPGPRGINITVKPVFRVEIRSILLDADARKKGHTSVRQPVVK